MTIESSQISARPHEGSRLYLAIAGFVLLLVAGWVGYRAVSYEADAIRCGEERMAPTDVCLSYGDGGGTYDEMRAAQERSHTVDIFVAAASAILAVPCLVLAWLLPMVRRGRAPS